MKSPVIKRSIVIAGHKTSVSLEDAFWKALKDIATARRATLSDVVAGIDSQRLQGNLSSAIRLYVLAHFQSRADGHVEANGVDLGRDDRRLGEKNGGDDSAPSPRSPSAVAPARASLMRAD